MPDQEWRKLSKHEREILERMLQEPFPRADELRRQLASARVKTLDDDGSLGFDTATDVTPGTGYESPVTAVGQDQDGVHIEMGLLVQDGKLSELDVWKGDGSAIHKWPSVSDVQVLITVPGYSRRFKNSGEPAS